jgi:hypothetical protein
MSGHTKPYDIRGLTTKDEDLRWLSIAIMRIDSDPPIECPANINLWLGAVYSDKVVPASGARFDACRERQYHKLTKSM